MKINVAAVAKAVVILFIVVILPIIILQQLPEEFERFFTTQAGLDIAGLITEVAVFGVISAVFVALRGHAAKNSAAYFGLTIGWQIFLLFVVFFILGGGRLDTFGLFTVGGKSGSAENTVVFDFRLFTIMSIIVDAVVIARLTLQFQEARAQAKSQKVPETVGDEARVSRRVP
jgi:hypothetical protein